MSVWSTPTIDAKRGLLYAATGNGYADPPQPTTDAVIAIDLKTGKIKWSSQVMPKDVWILGCGGRGQTSPNPNCPDDVGPDFDFSASPILTKLSNGRELIAKNAAPPEFPEAQLVAPRQIVFKSEDGLDIHGQLFVPKNQTARGAALIFMHGGPIRQMLLGRHYMEYYSNAYGMNQYLASKGYTVLR